jgi:hypothetical protein
MRRFGILVAVNLKITAFLDVTLCDLLQRYQYFGRSCWIHLQGRRALCQVATASAFKQPSKLRVLQSASELYRPSDRRLLAKIVPTFADRGCHMVSATDPPRSLIRFSWPEPQLYSRGWVDPVPDPLLLRRSGSAGNRIRDLWICSQELWPLNPRGGQAAF